MVHMEILWRMRYMTIVKASPLLLTTSRGVKRENGFKEVKMFLANIAMQLRHNRRSHHDVDLHSSLPEVRY